VEARESHIDELLRLHREAGLRPVPVPLGGMPRGATLAMCAIADDIALRLGLFLADGVIAR
jgi:hypothetical protein